MMDVVGGELNVFIVKEYICYYVYVFGSDLLLVVDLVVDVVFNGCCVVDDVEVECDVVFEEIVMCDDDFEDVLVDMFLVVLFGDYLVGCLVIGSV